MDMHMHMDMLAFLNGVNVRLYSPAVTVWNSTPSAFSRS